MAIVPVVVLAGQSNAAYGGIDNRIVEGLTSSEGAFEFVKVAVGGTSLFGNADIDWDPESNELFATLVTKVLAAIDHVRSQGHEAAVTLLWVQGEADVGRSAPAYAAKLNQFIYDFRREIGIPGAEVHIALLPFESGVTTAQLQVIDRVADVFAVDTTGAKTWDTAHYDRETRIAIADRFIDGVQLAFEAVEGYRSLLAPTTVRSGDGVTDVQGSLYLDVDFAAGTRPHWIKTFSGDDRIEGGSSSDMINSGDGDDMVFAGSGDDNVDAGSHDDEVDGGTGRDVILGRHGDDRLFGGDGDDPFIAGGPQDDHIFGGAGDDQIAGEDGNDFLDGGPGVDTLRYDVSSTGLVLAPVRVSLATSGAQNTLGAGVDTILGFENLIGSPFDDVLGGDSGDNVIEGGGGRDVFTGGGGSDTFRGSAAHMSGNRITDFGAGDRIVIEAAAGAASGIFLSEGTLFAGDVRITVGVGSFRLAVRSTTIGTEIVAVARQAPSDFNGDGHSDILFQNVGGAVSSWNVSGNVRADQLQKNSYFANAPSSWNVVETFDMNGDGRSDILWRNTDGTVAAWQGQGAGFNQSSYLTASPGASWKIAATGDTNGDGRDDMLWRHDDGSISAWRSTGAGFDQNSYFRGSVGANWRVAGLADFDGDGRDDILWREAGGAISEWLSTGSGFAENRYFDASVSAGSGWKVAALADFDGDGRDDVFWRNDNGEVSVWQAAAAGGFAKNTFFAKVGSEWSVAQAGDFNADGRADLLWRNTDGAISLWQSNGAAFDQNVLFDRGPAPGWTIQAHDFLI